MMLGSSRTGLGDAVEEWETLRIERNAGIEPGPIPRLGYFASPWGRNATLFAGSSGPGRGVTFTNVANDYPQRIRYWREGAAMVAEVAMADGSRARRWRFRRMRD
jgi:hypothetical protein